ncbi:MAG: hypothetical protein ACYC2U_03985 [Candidatus Amoebophilus sp.]
MIKTVIIPKENTLHLSIPNNYIGKEIEILLYAKDELLEKTTQSSFTRFKGLLSSEEADKYHAYLKQTHNEWNRDI